LRGGLEPRPEEALGDQHRGRANGFDLEARLGGRAPAPAVSLVVDELDNERRSERIR
jgi:hypothetical protein